MRRLVKLGPIPLLVFLMLAACGGPGTSGSSNEIRIAQQYGIGYAPLVVLEERPEIAEKYLPDAELTWTQLGAGTSLRDAMLAGELDVGSGGVGPVIDGVAKGVEFRVATGLVEMPIWMVSTPKGPTDLEGFGDGDKIAIPGINSTQHVVLRAALEEQGLDSTGLDENFSVMPHPDGFSAFLSDQVAAHISSAPFQYDEVAEGGSKLVDSYDLWGRHTFLTTYVTDAWAEQNPEMYDGLVAAINEATKWLNENKKEAAQLLSDASEGTTSADEYLDQLNEPTLTFTTDVRNTKPLADAMYDLGIIDSRVSSEEVFFESAGVGEENW